MIVKSLLLRNFRNHTYLTYDFSLGLNVITGANAVGKTNIVEAIHYLSLGQSFRTNEISDLIQKGSEQAKIDVVIQEGEIERKITAVLLKSGHVFTINGKPVKKLSELSKYVNVIIFEPKDVLMFRGLPKDRRNFLNVSIGKKSPNYIQYLSTYEKLLKERNEILKASNIDEKLLDINTEMLVKTSHVIVKYRKAYTEDINDILNKITRALTGTCEKFELHYYPYVECNSEFVNNAKNAFKKALENDLAKKVTSIGCHREDFSMSLNGRDIGEFGSQGENRIAALALKLAPYFLIEDKEKRPIVVLDDVMSELDENHKERLITFLKRFEQVFITGTKLEIPGSNHYQIKKKTKEVF